MIIPILDFAPRGIQIIAGGVRSFKGVEGVRLMLKAQKEGYEILTNYILDPNIFPNYVKLDHEDPERLKKQLYRLMEYRSKNRDFHDTLLVLDEASDFADALDFKENQYDSSIYKQLGKVGITTIFIFQAMDMAYNRIRFFTNYLKITKSISPNSPYYFISVFEQNPRRKEEYLSTVIQNIPFDARKYWDFYDTNQIFYFNRKAKG